MMDDIVGLVTVQVVSGLGKNGGVTVEAILRPVGASFGMIAATIFVGWLGTRVFKDIKLPERFRRDGLVCGVQTTALLAFVAVAGYSGTSVLFGAFIAGTMATWLDETRGENRRTGLFIFEKYYSQVVERILVPFFFASIGFSVPIKRMFDGAIVWKGVVYSLLMITGKLVTGIWILPADVPFNAAKFSSKFRGIRQSKEDPKSVTQVSDTKDLCDNKTSSPSQLCSSSDSNSTGQLPEVEQNIDEIMSASNQISANVESKSEEPNETNEPPKDKPLKGTTSNSIPNPPISIYPSLIVGLAMVARGEIAFLIASIASANGILASSQENTESKKGSNTEDDNLYLIVIWAAVICTVVGPIGVGLLVRRVKRLEDEKRHSEGDECKTGRRVMGEWGVVNKGE
ncbi:hypothetical protein AA313_de0207752 [Arthrobotrys entomopaga]|nr:hypothetical protein AA313_de0207752 [Arthrobotrys entomopaga]